MHESPTDIDASAWNGLLDTQPSPTPFLRHEFLAAAHESGSAAPDTGWTPRWLSLERDGRLLAGCPLYLKTHSYGEYVFDWSWAEAWARHGLRYYPKLVGAAPFSPVPGSRLLAVDDLHRDALVGAIETLVQQAGLSSAHLLFVDAVDRQALERRGWLMRHNVQFHWQRDEASPVADFDALLATMQRDKRKKIQQERRRVREAGVDFRVLAGSAIGSADWDFFYRCHRETYAARGSAPYLTREFFARVAASMPATWVMFLARQHGEPIACSLIAADSARGLAWGRYWGATRHVPCLHFEACYYQPLQWCIEHGLRRFEGGAQGEHKMARGLLPVPTASAHWIADPRFREAVARALARERDGVASYVDELQEHSPFKAR